MLPLLRDQLTEPERLQFGEMLPKVASAHSAPSELQREAIVRFRRRLLAASPALAADQTGDFAR